MNPCDVVICSKNREKLCIEQVQRVKQKIPYKQIIVVDSTSTPYTNLPNDIIHLHTPDAKLGYARSAGVDQVEADNILVLDDDLIYEDNFYELLYNSLYNGDITVWAASGNVIWGWPDHPTIMKLNYASRSIGHSGGCVLFKTKILKENGSYHSDMHRGEDTELCYRLSNCGYKWLRVKEAYAYHPISTKQYLLRAFKNASGLMEIWKTGGLNIWYHLARRTARPVVMPFYYGYKTRSVKVYFLYLVFSLLYAFSTWYYFLKGWRRWLD